MCAYAPRPRKKRYVMCNVAVAVCANALESVRVSVEWREKKGREAMIHRECLSWRRTAIGWLDATDLTYFITTGAGPRHGYSRQDRYSRTTLKYRYLVRYSCALIGIHCWSFSHSMNHFPCTFSVMSWRKQLMFWMSCKHNKFVILSNIHCIHHSVSAMYIHVYAVVIRWLMHVHIHYKYKHTMYPKLLESISCHILFKSSILMYPWFSSVYPSFQRR